MIPDGGMLLKTCSERCRHKNPSCTLAMHTQAQLSPCMQVIGAPTIFNGLWSMLQPLVDPVSRKKIHMLPCGLPFAVALPCNLLWFPWKSLY